MSIFLHFTCRENKDSILKNGLLVNSNPTIDESVNDKLYFIKYNVYKSINDFYNNKAIDVIHELLYKCEHIDVWGVLDNENNNNKYNFTEKFYDKPVLVRNLGICTYEFTLDTNVDPNDLIYITSIPSLDIYINDPNDKAYKIEEKRRAIKRRDPNYIKTYKNTGCLK